MQVESVGPVTEPPARASSELGPLFRLVRDQRVAFLIVGMINTVLGTLYFILFQTILGQRFGTFTYMLSLGLAHIAAVLCAFVLHRRFVFRVRGHLWLDLGRFELVNLGALAFNAIALPFAVQILGFAPIPAQLAVTAVTALVSYFGHRNFSFRRARASQSPSQQVAGDETGDQDGDL